jgi:hypothetical protein
MNGSVIRTVFTPLAFKSEIILSGFGKLSLSQSKFPIVPLTLFPNQYKSRIIASTGI